jgi:hypothetical protein
VEIVGNSLNTNNVFKNEWTLFITILIRHLDTYLLHAKIMEIGMCAEKFSFPSL